MYKKALGVIAPVTIAFLILAISIFSTSQVVYVFSQSATPAPILGQKVDIDYQLPYAGKIEPDHILWPLKAFRDRVWLLVNLGAVKESEILMLLANKRIMFAKNLMAKEKSELSVSTLTKAEKYLEEAMAQEKEAREKKMDTSQVSLALAMSALKHRQILEEILATAPEDAKPVIVKTIDINKRLFNEVKMALNSQGLQAPENPFKD